MPWFRCLIRGENFVTSDDEAMGFYTTRWIRSEDAESAELDCLERLKNEEELRQTFPLDLSPAAKVYFEEVEELAENPNKVGGGFTFFGMSDAGIFQML